MNLTTTEESQRYANLAGTWYNKKKGRFNADPQLVITAIAEFMANIEGKTLFAEEDNEQINNDDSVTDAVINDC